MHIIWLHLIQIQNTVIYTTNQPTKIPRCDFLLIWAISEHEEDERSSSYPSAGHHPRRAPAPRTPAVPTSCAASLGRGSTRSSRSSGPESRAPAEHKHTGYHHSSGRYESSGQHAEGSCEAGIRSVLYIRRNGVKITRTHDLF